MQRQYRASHTLLDDTIPQTIGLPVLRANHELEI
jgi:hypothetical protein